MLQNLGAYNVQLFVTYHKRSGGNVEASAGPVSEGEKLRFTVPSDGVGIRFDLKMVETGETIMMRAYRNSAEMESQCTNFQVFGKIAQAQWQFRCI